jgi:AcrR family transcriptional regulator
VGAPTSVSKTSRRGRPRAEDSPASSDEIFLAALRAFATRGYDGTSVRELNQQLGVSHNLLNRRFGSKEQLWRATVAASSLDSSRCKPAARSSPG